MTQTIECQGDSSSRREQPPARSLNKRISLLGAAALIVATGAALGACTVGRSPAASAASTQTAGSSQPVPPSGSPEPIGSFEAGAKTLRTIAASTDPGSRLTIGREIAANTEYTSRAATYTSDGLTISAVLHVPLSTGSHPGLVLVHGFVDPATYTTGQELQREQDFLARAGYVVLYTDLRGLAGSDPTPAGPPDLEMGATDDVINAVTALATSGLPGLDGTRIGLLGHSLGGLLVLNVLVAKPGLVDAAVALAPSGSDRYADVELYLAPDDPIRQALIAAHGTPATNPQYWADVSPRTFVDRVTAPLLIVQGDVDVDVPPAGTKETVAVWQKAGKDIEFITLKGENHVFEARWHEAMDSAVAFFAKQLQ